MNLQQLSPYVGAVLRHLITGLAGALVTAGAVQPDQQTQFVSITTGIGVFAFGQVWSWWQKHQQAQALKGASK